MHPLKRPRRIGITLVIFATLTGGGLIGIASASDDLPALAFTFASLREGDRGVYEITGDTRVARNERTEGTFTFEVRERLAIVDGAGDPRIVDDIAFVDDRADIEYNWDFPVSHGILVDSMTSQPVAVIEEWNDIEDEGQQVGDARTHYFLHTGISGVDVLPCGLHAPWQGQLTVLGAEFGAMPCMGQRQPGQRAIVAGVGENQTGAVVVIEGRPHVEMQYVADVPVPVHVRLDGFEARLVGFERGQVQLPRLSLPDPVVPTLAPRTPWMFDESGIDHPFPASEAVTFAMEDPSSGLAAFLDENPDAYITYAWNSEINSTDYHTISWRLTWRDEDSAHLLNIVKRWERPASDERSAIERLLGQEPPTPEAEPTVSHEEGWWDSDVDEPWFPAPDMLPTVATMWEYYDRWATAELREKGPNYWEWTMLESRGEPRFLIDAGRRVDYPDGAGDPTLDYLRDWAFLEYDLGPNNDELIPFRWSDRGFVRYAQPQEVPMYAHSIAAVEMRSYAAFTPIEVVGVGVTAGLLAILYYLWPVLKTGGVGLFSRVSRAEILDHPTRRTIHDYIAANPGSHYHGMLSAMGLAKGTLQHHLRKLEEAGLVTSAKSGGYRCFFLRGERDHSAMHQQGVVKSPIAKGIVEICAAEPGITTGELATRLSVAPATISYHLKRLRGAGIIATQGRGHVPVAA